MPPTLEVACTNADCALDMFEAHYSYEMVGETNVDDLRCPYCGRTDSLERLSYTYDDANDRHR
jgi:aspartate carbamoyltransferase regulatory subunit